MMTDEHEEFDPEVVRRSAIGAPGPAVLHDRSRPARLVARLYAGVGTVQRSRLLGALLRPLSPLALVAVASGAFACFLGRGAVTALDDLGRFSTDQIFELARFVEQVSPEALRSVALALGDTGTELSAFAAAATVLLMRAVDDNGASQAPALEA